MPSLYDEISGGLKTTANSVMLRAEHHISDYDGEGKIEVLIEKRTYGPLSDSVNQ